MQIRGLTRLLPDRDSTGSCLDSSKLNRGQVKKARCFQIEWLLHVGS